MQAQMTLANPILGDGLVSSLGLGSFGLDTWTHPQTNYSVLSSDPNLVPDTYFASSDVSLSSTQIFDQAYNTVTNNFQRVEKKINGPGGGDNGGKSWFKDKFVKYAAYPLIMGAAIGAGRLGIEFGIGEVPMMIGVTLSVFGATRLLEALAPYERSWSPSPREFQTDFLHTVVSNGILPKLFRIGTVGIASAMAYGMGYDVVSDMAQLSSVWTTLGLDHLPFALQAVAVGLVADFAFYWAHRIQHETDALWPIHAVHHGPEMLTTQHAGRTHPFSAIATYGLMLGATALTGAPEEVLYMSTIIHATNGFLQHANVDFSLGPLDYWIAGAKAHRMHHSRIPDEGNSNFGSTYLVWDHVPWSKIPIIGRFLKFEGQTLYLPEDHQYPDQVGIEDENGTLVEFLDNERSAFQNYWDHFLYPFKEWKKMRAQNTSGKVE